MSTGLFIAIMSVIVPIGVIAFIILVFQNISDFFKGEKEDEPSADWSFKKLNYVEGVLTVDGRDIPTYNLGVLSVGKHINIHFFDNARGTVHIMDILYQGTSLFLSAPTGSHRAKCDYAVQVLKTWAHQGHPTMELALEIEQIILEVDELNDLVKQGKVVQRGEDGDFAWTG